MSILSQVSFSDVKKQQCDIDRQTGHVPTCLALHPFETWLESMFSHTSFRHQTCSHNCFFGGFICKPVYATSWPAYTMYEHHVTENMARLNSIYKTLRLCFIRLGYPASLATSCCVWPQVYSYINGSLLLVLCVSSADVVSHVQETEPAEVWSSLQMFLLLSFTCPGNFILMTLTEQMQLHCENCITTVYDFFK